MKANRPKYSEAIEWLAGNDDWLWACPRCRSKRGRPCRTRGQNVRSHAERIALQHQRGDRAMKVTEELLANCRAIAEASPQKAMADAKKDGSVIVVRQRRKRAVISERHRQFDVVPARWHTNPPGTPVVGYWRLLHASTHGRQDEDLEGWWSWPE